MIITEKVIGCFIIHGHTIIDFFIPHYIGWENNVSGYLISYTYDALFDVDEEMFLYFKLKFCS